MSKPFSKFAFIAHILLLSAVTDIDADAASSFAVNTQTKTWVSDKWGADALLRVEQWEALIVNDSKHALSDVEKLEHANTFFNQVEWLTDAAHWQQEDYWATPVETLASNGGDCEDYSIGKFVSLANVELAPEKLRITYVKSLSYNQAHMVLAYYETPGAEPLILDNINKSILPASQRQDLLPIYSFDARNVWLSRDRSRFDGKGGVKGDSMSSLPKWKAVQERIDLELKPEVKNVSS